MNISKDCRRNPKQHPLDHAGVEDDLIGTCCRRNRAQMVEASVGG